MNLGDININAEKELWATCCGCKVMINIPSQSKGSCQDCGASHKDTVTIAIKALDNNKKVLKQLYKQSRRETISLKKQFAIFDKRFKKDMDRKLKLIPKRLSESRAVLESQLINEYYQYAEAQNQKLKNIQVQYFESVKVELTDLRQMVRLVDQGNEVIESRITEIDAMINEPIATIKEAMAQSKEDLEAKDQRRKQNNKSIMTLISAVNFALALIFLLIGKWQLGILALIQSLLVFPPVITLLTTHTWISEKTLKAILMVVSIAAFIIALQTLI